MADNSKPADLARVLARLSALPKFHVRHGRDGLRGYVEVMGSAGRMRGVHAGPCASLFDLVPALAAAVEAAMLPPSSVEAAMLPAAAVAQGVPRLVRAA